jgi:hypothetical protein
MNDSYVQSYVAFEGLPTPRFWSWMPRKIRRSYCDDSSAQGLVQPPLTSSVDPSAGLHRPSQWVLVRTLRYTVALFALLLPEEASDVSFAMAVCSSALGYNVTLTLHMG